MANENFEARRWEFRESDPRFFHELSPEEQAYFRKMRLGKIDHVLLDWAKWRWMIRFALALAVLIPLFLAVSQAHLEAQTFVLRFASIFAAFAVGFRFFDDIKIRSVFGIRHYPDKE
jgi:hypothetical protein